MNGQPSCCTTVWQLKKYLGRYQSLWRNGTTRTSCVIFHVDQFHEKLSSLTLTHTLPVNYDKRKYAWVEHATQLKFCEHWNVHRLRNVGQLSRIYCKNSHGLPVQLFLSLIFHNIFLFFYNFFYKFFSLAGSIGVTEA